jgi:DNA sulfur modification protein DndC
MPLKESAQKSIFKDVGFLQTIDHLIREIQEIYYSDTFPWVVGYSGGKDSTAVLQLVWRALEAMPENRKTKPIYVISTDTLVENPIVAAWVNQSLEVMAKAAEQQKLPITSHRLTPAIADTFWVNLIGRGYPAPRHKFRWCTERLKIKPSNRFIREVVRDNGEAILILGTRKAESAKRHNIMKKLEAQRTRDKLSPNANLPNCLVYTPISEWSNDDVWMYLMQQSNPWGYNNKDLLTMYQGASADGECPLVVDASTPSCGDSRFGCWVCTLVEQDKSMGAMIQNDEEKEWMLPLLELRNELDFRNNGDRTQSDRHLRDFRRMSGHVQLYLDRAIPGPYTQWARERWLRKVLEAQRWVRENGPSKVSGIELITLPELNEIRRLWVVEKHEFEDNLPKIYEEVTGQPFPGERLDDNLPFGAEELKILKELCQDHDLEFQLARELLDIERRFQTKARRAGLFGELESALRRHFYKDQDDALDFARRKRDAKQAIRREPEPQQGVLIV